MSVKKGIKEPKEKNNEGIINYFTYIRFNTIRQALANPSTV